MKNHPVSHAKLLNDDWKLISVASLNEFTFQVTAAVKNSTVEKALLGKGLIAG